MKGKTKKPKYKLELTEEEFLVLNSALGSTNDVKTPGSGRLWAQFQMLQEHGEVS